MVKSMLWILKAGTLMWLWMACDLAVSNKLMRTEHKETSYLERSVRGLFKTNKQTSEPLTDIYIEDMENEVMKDLRRQQKAAKQAPNSGGAGVLNCLIIPYNFVKFFKTLGQDAKKVCQYSTRPIEEPYITGVTKNIGQRSWKLSIHAIKYNDPYWVKQWYVQDYRTRLESVWDLNVVPVYNLKHTGDTVIVAVVGDGVSGNIQELRENFVSSLSYDFCEDRTGCEPQVVKGEKSSLGTKCAGVVAMAANNKICGVGIAYGAKVAGLRATCGPFYKSQYTYGRALNFNLHKFHIYLNAWGPPADPNLVHIVDRFVRSKYKNGVQQGRGGLGAIYIHGVGDGKDKGDSCATDGIINLPEVIGIGAADQFGKRTSYSETCAAVFSVAYSKGSMMEGVVAPTPDGRCTKNFGGTAAAASMAAGIVALVLQANPDLSYRDVMHLIVMSSEVAPLANNLYTWYKNGRGFYVSNDFGFGMMNAENMVKLAKNDWKPVPEKHTCVVPIKLDPHKEISRGRTVTVEFKTDGCADFEHERIRYLEHVELESVITFPLRGDIEIYIKSPSGTRSNLLARRTKDMSTEGLVDLSVMSLHTWGEDPNGKWTIEVSVHSKSVDDRVGHIKEFELRLHGTYDKPSHYKTPRIYSSFLTSDKQSNVVF